MLLPPLQYQQSRMWTEKPRMLKCARSKRNQRSQRNLPPHLQIQLPQERPQQPPLPLLPPPPLPLVLEGVRDPPRCLVASGACLAYF
jgi:hypothetical protein